MSQPPFCMLPDPDLFYPARPHREAYEVLRYGIDRDEGFMALCGYAGTGKTMLLRMLLHDLAGTKETAFIVTPAVGPRGLLCLLLKEMGENRVPSDAEPAVLLNKFQDAVLDLARGGRGLLIVVDEAQDLPLETIEQLRLLSNIETERKKLLQILLAGQPELSDLLADPRLCQLTQRIAIEEELKPLSLDETREYTRFRLSRAGRPDLDISKEVAEFLYRHTQGIPRLINKTMDRTMLMAAASGSKEIRLKDAERALVTLPAHGKGHGIRSLGLLHEGRRPPPWLRYIAAGTAAAFIVIGVIFAIFCNG